MATIIKTDLEFGTEYEDSVSGFKGKCTGIVQHQYGCIRALLQPRIDRDGKLFEGQWFDEPQLITPKIKKPPGGPTVAPKRNPDPSAVPNEKYEARKTLKKEVLCAN